MDARMTANHRLTSFHPLHWFPAVVSGGDPGCHARPPPGPPPREDSLSRPSPAVTDMAGYPSRGGGTPTRPGEPQVPPGASHQYLHP